MLTEQFDPYPHEYLDPGGVGVDHNPLPDQFSESVEPRPEQRAEFVVGERNFPEPVKPKDRANDQDTRDQVPVRVFQAVEAINDSPDHPVHLTDLF